MLVMMKCVAEAIAAKGVKGLAEVVPGGPYLFDVAADALKRLRERKRATELRAEVLAAAQATNEEAKQIAAQVAREVAGAGPPEDRIALEMYLTQIPGAVRQSLRRPDDPSGRSVPAEFGLNDPADLLKRLPGLAARFRPGDPLPGKPGWQLVELLGTGGFGEVWLARNPALSALKGAVKFGLDPQARDRLLRHEGSLVNRVMEQGKHPNVVPLLDAHLEGDAPWLMYEYVPGGDLTGLIFSWQGLPAEERVKRATAALRTLASAVGHFHRLRPPLVHRDLKPANILVGGEVLKIADFGIGGAAAAASLAENATRRSSVGYLASQLWGSHTPLYASPQQQRGDAPDPRDDVHALGVIGFQMLTGKLDATLGADYAKTLRRLNVPEPLVELLGDFAAHDADNRPKDAQDLAERLAACDAARPAPRPVEADTQLVPCPQCKATLKAAKGETRPLRCSNCGHTFRPFPPPPPAPPPPTPVERPRAKPVAAAPAEPPPALPQNLRGARRRKWDEDAAEPPPLPEDHEPVLRGKGFTRALLLIIGLVFAVCLGVPLLVFVWSSGSGGKVTTFRSGGGETVEQKTEKQHTIRNVPGRTADLFFSPDGTKLATVSADGHVVVWAVPNGGGPAAEGKFLTWEGQTRTGGTRPAFSPDSSRFAVGDPGDAAKDRIEIFRSADAGGVSNTLPDARTGLADAPLKLAFSPDGQWLVAGGAANGWVKVWDANKAGPKPLDLSPVPGQVTHTLDGEPAGVAAVEFAPGGKRLLTAGGDTLRLWKPEQWPGSLAPEQSFTHSGKITAAGIDPDPRCRWVAAGGANGVVRVWDIEKPNKVYEQTKTNQGAIKQLAFSTFRHVAALDGAGVGYLWEARNPARATKIDWHGTGTRVNAVAFNPEGSLLATAGDDKVIRFWDQFWGRPHETTVTGHAAAVTALAYSPDGNRLAAADASGTVIVWQVPNPKKKLGD